MGKLKKEFLVALHVSGIEQAIEQSAKILTPDGAHGVILVNNGFRVMSRGQSPTMPEIASKIKSLYPDHLIGINMLDLSTEQAIEYVPSGLDILWTDLGGVEETGGYAFLAPWFSRTLKTLKPRYYGSELFKVGLEAENPEAVAKCAAEHFSAMVTSGKATGSAPDVKKLRQIREWIGRNAKLINASGTSIDNVDSFLPYVDGFIVGTSLCEGDGHGENAFLYVPEKVRAFRAKLDAWETDKQEFYELQSHINSLRHGERPQSPAAQKLQRYLHLGNRLGIETTLKSVHE